MTRTRTNPLGLPIPPQTSRVPTGEFDVSEISGVEDVPHELRQPLQSMARRIVERAHTNESNAMLDFASRLGSVEARLEAVDDGGGMSTRIAENTASVAALRTVLMGERGDNGKIGTLTARVAKFESIAMRAIAVVIAVSVGAIGTAWTVNRRIGEAAGEAKAAVDAERSRFGRIEHELEILRAEIRAGNINKGIAP